MDKEKIICFDVETTGLDVYQDEILSLSIIDGNGEILFNHLIKPSRHDEWEAAAAINGIYPETVAEEKTIDEYKGEIDAIFANAEMIVGYNSDNFDIPMLRNNGIDIVNVDTFDVMLEFAPIYGEINEYYGNYRWQKLVTCADYFGYEPESNWHESLEDTRATLFCYYKVQDMLSIKEKLEGLSEMAQKKIFDTCFTKHRIELFELAKGLGSVCCDKSTRDGERER